ncbi:MAG: DEAD/DEAH box helicase [Desulfobacterales bacterium]|nr:DEAD/DEAH box helicase [Desulfobacterales bacterium]
MNVSQGRGVAPWLLRIEDENMPESAKKRLEKTPSLPPRLSDAMSRLEFHRNALALLPALTDKRPGAACIVVDKQGQPAHQSCACRGRGSRTCPHIMALMEIQRALRDSPDGKSPWDRFKTGVWGELARVLGEGSRETPETVAVKTTPGERGKTVKVFSARGVEMLTYLRADGPDCGRFLERCAHVQSDSSAPVRGEMLKTLTMLTLTESERAMLNQGFETRGLALEKTFWHRLAYHGRREFGEDGCAFHPAVEESTGAFLVACHDWSGAPVFRMTIPGKKVRAVLKALANRSPDAPGLAIHPVPLETIFDVSRTRDLDLEIRPMLRMIQKNGEVKFFDAHDIEKYRYGSLLYIKELGVLAESAPSGARRSPGQKTPVKTVIERSRVPAYLENLGDAILSGEYRLDETVEGLRIYKEADRVSVSPRALERNWCWLSVEYGFGNTSISLAELLRAREEGRRFISVDDGWVDCGAAGLEGVASSAPATGSGKNSNQVRLSRLDLFRLSVGGRSPLTVTGRDKRADILKRMLRMKPSGPLPPLKGMTSTLRNYQVRGVEWVRFLFENGFGGLLCDDMGLGKTHQVMAFMLFLKETGRRRDPFLVVCPTTVLSHWRQKIREHAPGLTAAVHHGADRDLAAAMAQHDVILTSYGILRRDIDQLAGVSFGLAVFDEIQHIKNRETLAYRAASTIRTGMRLGLTGTPIENSLQDLKNLMDLTIPDYLGSDQAFQDRYIVEGDDLTPHRGRELNRRISPFVLRRLKKTVLDELPVKIEDIRTCPLSEDQVKLYRDAVDGKGRKLLNALGDDRAPAPYIHIFALLTLLKQICDHPALVDQSRAGTADPLQLQSGKWDLFKELLAESLDSGQKVVVYSQFLGMIEIIRGHLETRGVGHAILTGKSRRRGQIISRFNEDPDCRVFVGSLKAGGVGIDLAAASVVIHYDRWWNAAREDQATDRVHRIGQTRGVQVFKLVTRGTLEEKISAIIERKRDLMEKVVKEDDPGLIKIFTRDELIDMLSLAAPEFRNKKNREPKEDPPHEHT